MIIPNIWENKEMFQTTNQYVIGGFKIFQTFSNHLKGNQRFLSHSGESSLIWWRWTILHETVLLWETDLEKGGGSIDVCILMYLYIYILYIHIYIYTYIYNYIWIYNIINFGYVWLPKGIWNHQPSHLLLQVASAALRGEDALGSGRT